MTYVASFLKATNDVLSRKLVRKRASSLTWSATPRNVPDLLPVKTMLAYTLEDLADARSLQPTITGTRSRNAAMDDANRTRSRRCLNGCCADQDLENDRKIPSQNRFLWTLCEQLYLNKIAKKN